MTGRRIRTNWITECSAMKNRGVNEAFTEAARVALQVKNVKGDKQKGLSCSMM
jgi:Rho family protein